MSANATRLGSLRRLAATPDGNTARAANGQNFAGFIAHQAGDHEYVRDENERLKDERASGGGGDDRNEEECVR